VKSAKGVKGANSDAKAFLPFLAFLTLHTFLIPIPLFLAFVSFLYNGLSCRPKDQGG